jgi:phosphopantetheine adenylyltransferase/predicted metal-dependent HD superfamily phosphohydrolase
MLDKFADDMFLLDYSYNLFAKYGISSKTFKEKVLTPYYEPHRYFHTYEVHVAKLLAKIHRDYFIHNRFTEAEVELLVFTTWFHDIVYDPRKTNNEEASVEYFKEIFGDVFVKTDDSYKTIKNIVEQVSIMILDTKKHIPTLPLSDAFCSYDMSDLYSEENLADTEYQIFKEYQCYPVELYKAGRIDFLEKQLIENNKLTDRCDTLKKRIDWVKAFKPKIGLFAGSFNPYHIGHDDTRSQAEPHFDKIILLWALNAEKKNDTFKFNFVDDKGLEREVTSIGYVKEHLYNEIDVLPEGMLLTDYINNIEEKTGCSVTLVRSLRNGDDLKMEETQLYAYRMWKPDLKAVFFLGKQDHHLISSTLIRTIDKLKVGTSNNLFFLSQKEL